MSDPEVLHPVPVRDLTERLGLSRSRVFSLLSELAIARITDDGRTCVSGEDFLLLEQAVTFTRNGGSMASFKESQGISALAVTDLPQQSSQSTASPLDALLMAVAALVERQPGPALPPATAEVEAGLALLQRRIDILRTLADAGMSIPNAELADLLDVAPATLRSRGQTFTAYGLRFSRTTEGRSVSWRVSRPVQ